MTDAYRIRTDETWTKARGDYLAGFTAEEVCSRHDLGLSALRQRARREGWRRADQDDPDPIEDDLDDLSETDPTDLVRMAYNRLGQAIRHGRASDAIRWQRIHATLHAQAQAELRAAHHDAHMERFQASMPGPRRYSPPTPRLTPTGENVHDVHANSSDDPNAPPLSRAERRRRLREERRRS